MSLRPSALILKDPSSIELRGFDWTSYLADLGSGVTIVTSTYTVTGGDAPTPLLILSSPEILSGSLKTQVVLSAGTLGKRYVVTNRIVTSSSPVVTDERSFRVLVQNR